METLDVRVLRELARLNMRQLDLPFDRPSQEMTTGQFWFVVAANRLRLATLCNLVQHARHATAGKAGVDLQREALSRIRIHHVQHPDRPARSNRIVRKIQCPFPVGGCVLAYPTMR